MGWGGSSHGAIVIFKNNRSLTYRKNAIRNYKRKANQIRTTPTKDLKDYSFTSKSYNAREWADMKKAIRREIRMKMFLKLGFAIAVFIALCILIWLFFSSNLVDRHLFWAR